uniref:FBA_2 domain-containing protein n=1 Tax=Caenorhabditis tropicalis TaxID=1561998 RepID=A0A1I7TKY9_9PELO
MFKPEESTPYLGHEPREIGGIKIGIEKTPFWISSQNPPIQIKIACDYVLNLFRLPMIHYFLFLDDHKELFPKRFGVTKCDHFSVQTIGKFPTDELKYVLEKVQVSELLLLSLEISNDFELGFVQFSICELKIFRAFWITKETFLAMDCARIDLEYNRQLPIREFVSQWLSSRNTRFKWLRMSWEKWDVNWGKGFKPMECNPAIRGRYFRMGYNKLDCEKGIDFLRDDALLATVVVWRNYRIFFVVWHKRYQPDTDGLPWAY